jgi:hypothetical protein
MELLVFVAALAILAVLSLRFGVDTGDKLGGSR